MKNRQMMVMRELSLAPTYQPRPEGIGETNGLAPSAENMVSPPDIAVAAARLPQPDQPPEPLSADRRTIILKMEWPDLKAAVAGCVACKLHTARNKTVFGVGDENASWLFVGEGPGADEDRQGEPFVGQAGKLLDNMLAAIDLRRGEDVYIANIVKCRPPGNRNPEPDEAQSCEPYLTRQIQLIKPKLIVALGKTAIQNLLGTDAAVGSLRGRLHQYQQIPLLVTYHPAYLLRTPGDKARAWEDLCLARTTMASLKSAVAAS
ncbi:MAG: uracil-DNA glycosylase [Pseudomonadota bacterium]